MKSFRTTLFVSALVFLAAGVGGAGAQDVPSCDEFRCQFQQQIETECPCDAQSNHGQYVRCVAHVVNDLVAAGLPTDCKGKLTKCAARSVCGKQARGFATCTTFEYGACVANEGLPSTCDTDPTIECTVDTDCVASSRCRLTRHVDRCIEDGGAVNLAPTCCSNCVTPP